MNVREELFALQDADYRTFNSRLIPTVDPNLVIGVRVPELRKLAKRLAKTPEAALFLQELPHEYYEENCLHGFLIEQIRSFDACVEALYAFLPYVDNWATCDMTSPKVLKQNLPGLLSHVRRWIESDHPYMVRFGILCLMRYYLDDAFQPQILEMVSVIHSKEYYVNMMIAWFFAEALVKQHAAALPYLEEHRLAAWTHNKAIQKARESLRVTSVQKEYLKTLKRLP